MKIVIISGFLLDFLRVSFYFSVYLLGSYRGHSFWSYNLISEAVSLIS